jgi:hypothetical protein
MEPPVGSVAGCHAAVMNYFVSYSLAFIFSSFRQASNAIEASSVVNAPVYFEQDRIIAILVRTVCTRCELATNMCA